MLCYRPTLKDKARQLRSNLTESESRLWSRLRGKQLLGVQFYRQKPIGNYVVDFFAPKAKLVIEVDGSQHRQADELQRDKTRDASFADLGMKVLRFNSREVMSETDAVVEVIYRRIAGFLNPEIPPDLPLQKGGEKVFHLDKGLPPSSFPPLEKGHSSCIPPLEKGGRGDLKKRGLNRKRS